MDNLVGDLMANKYKWLQKNYPAIVLLLAHIVGGILWFSMNLVSEEKQEILYTIVGAIFYGTALACVAICIISIVRFRRLSKDAQISYAEYLNYSYEIKCAHNEIHKALLFFGILLLVPVITALSSLHMLLLGTTMLIHTGYISTIGIRKMCIAEELDKTYMVKYVISQYIPFCDKKVLSKILKEKKLK